MKKFYFNFYGFKLRGHRIALLLSCFLSATAFAAKPANHAFVPPKTITGVVKDQNGSTLPGVSIRIKGKTIGTVTDVNGKFSLNVPDGDNVLVVSYVGFATQEVNINGKTSVSIALSDNVGKLSEVVVVGYGTQSREKLTTSIAKLDARVLNDVPLTNVGYALEGNVAGLVVQTVSGQPGAAPRIVLRGGTSINNPNGAGPLYIIDGIIRPNGLNDINSNDIESLQILKDAAATAIYGARGSNGVIIATTKRGKPNKTQISYTFNGSAANAQRIPQYVDAHDYIYWNRIGTKAASVYNAALAQRLTQANASGTGNDLTKATAYTTQYLTPANQYKLNEGWQSMQDPIDPTKTIIFDDTNYSDLIYRTGYSADHYLSASGGTDKATFFTGLGYTNANGTALVTSYKRISYNLNGSYKIKDNLNVYGGLLYSNRTQNAVASLANVFYRSASLPGTAKYMFEDGTLAPGQNSSIGNPDYFFKGQYSPKGDNGVEDVATNLGLKWDIAKGLTFEPYASLLREGSYAYTFQPAALLNGVGTPVTSRNATQTDNVTRQYQADAVLTYVHTFAEKHNLEVKAGYSHYYRNQRNFNATGQNAATDLIPTLNGSATPILVNGNISTLALDGVFYRVNYDFDSKYLLSLTGRYDGASNLGQEHKFGFFPGVSAGWNVEREKFWQKIDPNDFAQLKLRASYGVNGNISGLGDFQAEGSFTTTGTDLYGGQAAIRQGVIPNPNLKWEQSKTFDVGADIGLFHHRVSMILDYYRRRTDDLLTTVSLPASSGFTSILTNFGSLQNIGYEAEISVSMLPQQSSFKWTLTANAAHTSRKILKLPFNGVANNRQGGVNVYDPATGTYVWMGGAQEGGRIGDMFGYKYLGVYATDADAAKAPIDNGISNANKTKYGGDAIYADLDGNGILDSRDQVYAGNPYPVWTGGFNNFFSYKQFTLDIRTDFTTGASIFNYPAWFADGQQQGDALPLQDYFDKMWKQQGDQASMPRYVWQSQSGNFRTSTMFYEKTDFLCLRAVSFGYTLPQSLIRKARMSSARLVVSGSNLYYFTKFSGPVPEGGGNDTANDGGGRYPIPRTFTLGVNVTF